jgi:hypothetical protein
MTLALMKAPMKDAARLILHHQERCDGSGFPDRPRSCFRPRHDGGRSDMGSL